MCQKRNTVELLIEEKILRLDSCMREFIKCLLWLNVPTIACCCGHDKYPMTVVVGFAKGKKPVLEIISNTWIDRSRNIYKKDSEGLYYIPEVIN